MCLQSKNEYYSMRRASCAPMAPSGFNTPPRVASSLYNLGFQQFGDDPLPYYEEPDFSPISTPRAPEGLPLRASRPAHAPTRSSIRSTARFRACAS